MTSMAAIARTHCPAALATRRAVLALTPPLFRAPVNPGGADRVADRVAPKTTGATTAAEEAGVAVAGDDDRLEATPAADTGVAAAGEDDMGAGLPPTPAVDASVAEQAE
ncbi:unnamed protein product [Ectocarpus sp. CCAP 1310/34]|nr:unnamed protein product [Ectocarpus sp. CCAP 1310/34]